MIDGLTPDVVRLAYRLFFDREPESAAVVESAVKYETLGRLRAALLASKEFQALVPPKNVNFVSAAVPPLDVEWRADETTESELLAHIKRTWSRLGLERPHHSVLGSPEYRPDRIDENMDAFYESGAQDCQLLVGVLARHGFDPKKLPRLFEFGCGLGRVTLPFAETFSHVTACDISPNHLALARQAVRGRDNIDFVQVEDSAFGMHAPFDVWFSRIVLQHNPPPLIAMILRRMLELLAPGGVAVFQVPVYYAHYRFSIKDYLRHMPAKGDTEMHVLPQAVILELARRAGCKVLEVWPDNSTGGSATKWISNLITIHKPHGSPTR